MKTLVLFQMPDGSYWSRWLSNLPAFPLEGMKYHVTGIAAGVYVATEVIQALGVDDGAEQLSALMALGSSDGAADLVLARSQIRDLDMPALDEIADADEFSLVEEVPDQVVLVRLRQESTSSIIASADEQSV